MNKTILKAVQFCNRLSLWLILLIIGGSPVLIALADSMISGSGSGTLSSCDPIYIEYRSYDISLDKIGHSVYSGSSKAKYLLESVSETASGGYINYNNNAGHYGGYTLSFPQQAACSGWFSYISELTWETANSTIDVEYYYGDLLNAGYNGFYSAATSVEDGQSQYVYGGAGAFIENLSSCEYPDQVYYDYEYMSIEFEPDLDSLSTRTSTYDTSTYATSPTIIDALRLSAIALSESVISPTEKHLSTDENDYTPGSDIYVLSDEFTTPEFETCARGHLTDQGTPGWGSGKSITADSSGLHSSNTSLKQNASRSLNTDEDHIELTKVEYHFKFKVPKGETRTFEWEEHFVPSNGGAATVTKKSFSVVGTGFTQYSPVFSLEATANGNSYVKAPQATCSTCVMGATSVGGNSGLPGVNVDINMGAGSDGANAGRLIIEGDSEDATLGTRHGITSLGGPEMETITDGGGVYQVKTPDGLAVLTDITGGNGGYKIEFYKNPGTKQGSVYTGYSGIISDATVTVTTNSSPTRIQVQTGGTGGPTSTFSWNSTNHGWDLGTGGGLRTERRIVNQTGTEEVYQILNGAQATIYQETNKFSLLTNGANVIRFLDTQVVGSGAGAQTYRRLPYTNSANFGQLYMSISPSGYWERYEYDTNQRITKIVAQYKNAATNAAESQCRVTTFSFTPLVTNDVGTADFYSPRSTLVKLLDYTNSQSYLLVLPGERRDIQCPIPGAAWNDTNNLVTITKYMFNTNGTGTNITLVQKPDGSVYCQQVTTNNGVKVEYEFSGEPDGTGTNVYNGYRTTITYNSAGNVSSRVTVVVNNGVNGITIGSEALTYGDSDNPHRMTYLTNTVARTGQTNHYDCCDLLWTADQEGILNSYTYNGLKRRITTTRAGITISNSFDAAGNLLATVRYGTNNSSIILSSAIYDAASQIAASYDALNHPTIFTNYLENNYQIRKTTFANNGTRLERYYQDNQLERVTGTAIHAVRYEYGAANGATYVKEFKLDGSEQDTSEWVKTWTDMLGRTFKVEYADGNYQTNSFNSKGQLFKDRDPDGIIRLYAYNGKGELQDSVLDIDQDGDIDYAGKDRVTRTLSDVISNGTLQTDVYRSQALVWNVDNQDSSIVASSSERTLDGRRTLQTVAGVSTTNDLVYAGSGSRYETNWVPDGTMTLKSYQNGLLLSTETSRAGIGTISYATFSYDAHGRQKTMTDQRTGTVTIYSYDNGDQATNITVTASGLPDQSTTLYFDEMGRVWKTVQPDGGCVTNFYFVTGELATNSGVRTYPVAYTYDYAGRTKTLKTWQDFAGGNGVATTTWNYDQYRGWLSSKQYQGGSGPSYTYTASGRLRTRVWARSSLTTTYTNNAAGEVKGFSYSDSTPAISFGFDRQGRITTATNGTSVTTIAYSDAGQVLSESRDGLAVTNSYDSLLRLIAVGYSSASATATRYGFDVASRLTSITNGSYTAAYNYLANSHLVSDITFKSNALQRMTSSRTYDNLNRLKSISAAPSGASAVSFQYAYNGINQRTNVVIGPENSSWHHGYDDLGQVISSKKYWADSSPVAGQQFEFDFDDIGNRLWTKMGGDTNGANLRVANYTNNLLNQITSRGAPGTNDIIGLAHASASVTINSQSPDRKGEYYHREISTNNSGGPASAWVTNLAVLNGSTQSVTGFVIFHKNGESLTYDTDGNLTVDSRYYYYWDAENRLTRVVSFWPADVRFLVDATYDYMSRRASKTVSNYTGSAWVLDYQRKYLYQGWNLVAELDGSNNVVRTHIWGNDASGSMQGAGGVGGLLATIIHNGSNAGTYFPAYDGNWDVVKYINASNGMVVAEYEYGPFHELIRASGSMAKEFNFLATTKYYDWETSLYYYGYRYYNPSTGRWLSRDPIEEVGSVNLYSFLANSISSADYLGLADLTLELGYTTKLPPHVNDGNWSLSLKSDEGAVTELTITPNVQSVSLNGPKGCKCYIDYADWKYTVKITYAGTIGHQMYKEAPFPQLRAHELAHAEGSSALAEIAMPYAIEYLMVTPKVKEGGWTLQECLRAQREDLESAATWVEKYAGGPDGPLYTFGHQCFGAFPKDWQAKGVLVFRNAYKTTFQQLFPKPYKKYW